MSDETPEFNALDAVELRNGLANVVAMVRHVHLQAVSEGFTEAQALEIAKVYLATTLGGGRA